MTLTVAFLGTVQLPIGGVDTTARHADRAATPAWRTARIGRRFDLRASEIRCFLRVSRLF